MPTVTESGLKGYELHTWHGLVGPKNPPAAIVGPVNGELTKILDNGNMREKLADDGVSVAGGTPKQFGTRIKREFEFWQHFVKNTGIKLLAMARGALSIHFLARAMARIEIRPQATGRSRKDAGAQGKLPCRASGPPSTADVQATNCGAHRSI